MKNYLPNRSFVLKRIDVDHAFAALRAGHPDGRHRLNPRHSQCCKVSPVILLAVKPVQSSQFFVLSGESISMLMAVKPAQF